MCSVYNVCEKVDVCRGLFGGSRSSSLNKKGGLEDVGEEEKSPKSSQQRCEKDLITTETKNGCMCVSLRGRYIDRK